MLRALLYGFGRGFQGARRWSGVCLLKELGWVGKEGTISCNARRCGFDFFIPCPLLGVVCCLLSVLFLVLPSADRLRGCLAL